MTMSKFHGEIEVFVLELVSDVHCPVRESITNYLILSINDGESIFHR